MEEKGEPMSDHHAVRWGRRAFLGSVPLVGAAGFFGLDWLARQPDVALQRCGIFGHSRGGLTALRTAAQDSRLRSVVSFAAPTDIPHYVRSVASFAPSRYQQTVEWMGGTPDELPER